MTGIRFAYNINGQDYEDLITGSIKWVEDPNRESNGKGFYEFNLRWNEEKNKSAKDESAAFENLSDRTGMASFKSLATTLLQSERYGTPIANGLRVLAQENRDTRMSLAEKKAASLPAQLTVPMIIFFLPVLFIIIAAPAGIQIVQMLSER